MKKTLLAGFAASMVMMVVEMLYEGIFGVGFWAAPVFIAATMFRSLQAVPLPVTFLAAPVALGFLAHLVNSDVLDAVFAALEDVKTYGNLPIPMRVRNAPTKLMKELGYHKGYKMYDTESYLPDKLKKKKYLEDES